jgi:hypothetical protein
VEFKGPIPPSDEFYKPCYKHQASRRALIAGRSYVLEPRYKHLMSSFNFQPLRDRADICAGSKAERDLDFYTPSSPHVFSRDQGSVTRRMRQFSGSNCQRGWRAPRIGNAAHLTLTPEPPPEPMASCTGSASSRKRTCLGRVTGHAAKVARLGRYRKNIDHRERTTRSDRVGPSAWTSIIYDL